MQELIGYLQILRRRWLIALAVFVSVLIFGFVRANKEVPLYKAKGQILVFNKPLPYSDKFAHVLEKKNLANELALIKSENLAEVVTNNLNLNSSVSNLLRQFNVINPEGTDILDFSYVSRDPQEAATILNAWMESYVKLDQQTVLSENLALQTFLARQIPESRENLELAAQNLKFFKQKNRILDIRAEAAATTKAINGLEQQIDNHKVQLVAENARLQSLQQIFGMSNSEDAILSTFVSESPIAKSMLEQHQKLKNEIDKERLRFGENHPQIANLKKQETVLRQQLQDYLGKILIGDSNRLLKYNDIDQIFQPGAIQTGLVQEYWGTQRKIQVLRQTLQSLEILKQSYKQRVNQIPELEFQQKQLEREVAAREKILENLIQSNQEVELALSKQSSNLELIQYAEVPTESFSNKKQSMLMRSLMTAVLMSCLSAYIIDKLDDKITDFEDVQKILDCPVLGRIPEFSEKNNIKKQGQFSQTPVIDLPNSVTSEAFRILFTGTSTLYSKENLKTILISSSIPSEGKSTMAANLALVGTEVGLKVLLIEADLRKPSQSSIWNIKSKKGLVDFLRGKSDIRGLLVSTAKNVDVLVAGKAVSNPLSLIASEKMTNLLKYCQEIYDLIIIDSPPLTVGAEAPVLRKMVDGILMISRLGRLTHSAVESSKQYIVQSDLKLIGLVCNALSPRDRYGYYKKYYYQKYYQPNSSPLTTS